MKFFEKAISSSDYRLLIAEIVKFRHKKSVTQIELGKKIKLSKSSVARIETCEQILSINNYFIIMTALGASKKEAFALLNKIF